MLLESNGLSRVRLDHPFSLYEEKMSFKNQNGLLSEMQNFSFNIAFRSSTQRYLLAFLYDARKGRQLHCD